MRRNEEMEEQRRPINNIPQRQKYRSSQKENNQNQQWCPETWKNRMTGEKKKIKKTTTAATERQQHKSP